MWRQIGLRGKWTRDCYRSCKTTTTEARWTHSGQDHQSPLAVTIPGMSQEEERHVRSQLSLSSSAFHYSMLMPSCPRCYKISEEFIRNFVPNIRITSKYRRVLFGNKTFLSPVRLQRLLMAMETFDVRRAEIEADPRLLAYPINKLPRDAMLREVLQTESLSEVQNARKRQHLRGRVIKDFFSDLTLALEVLNIEGFELTESRLGFVDGFSWNRKPVTYDQLNARTTKAILKQLLDEKVFEASGKIFSSSSTSPVVADTKMLLRNIYIYRFLLGQEIRNEKTLKNLSRLCPLESIINLNSFYRSINTATPSMPVSEFLAEFGRKSSKNFLLPSYRFTPEMRKRLLLDLGFSDQEANTILVSNSANSFGDGQANKLRLTSEDYLPKMQQRLRILREDGPHMGAIDPEDLFKAMTTGWDGFLQKAKRLAEMPTTKLSSGITAMVQTSKTPPKNNTFELIKVYVTWYTARISLRHH